MSDSSTVFDADALATEPPELKIGGRVYRGRVLSIVEWTPYLERFLVMVGREVEDLQKDELLSLATMQASHEFCAEYLRAVLPRRWPRPDPVALLERQGSRLLKQAFTGFFAQQCYVMGVALRTPTARAMTPRPPSPAPGNTSSGRTAPASDADALS